MDAESDISDLIFSRNSEGATNVSGGLREQNASDFESRLKTLVIEADGSVTLDLCGLDIEDGVALATCINALRELRARVRRLVLRGAPQMLGHNLYRVGMLEGPRAVEMVEMRLDEPSGV